MSSYEPVRSDHVKKLGQGRNWRSKRDTHDDNEQDEALNETEDPDDDGKTIKERSAVYPKQHEKSGSLYQQHGPYSFHSNYYGKKTEPHCEYVPRQKCSQVPRQQCRQVARPGAKEVCIQLK